MQKTKNRRSACSKFCARSRKELGVTEWVIGPRHQFLAGPPCPCDGNWAACRQASHCLAATSPERVFAALQNAVAAG